MHYFLTTKVSALTSAWIYGTPADFFSIPLLQTARGFRKYIFKLQVIHASCRHLLCPPITAILMDTSHGEREKKMRIKTSKKIEK